MVTDTKTDKRPKTPGSGRKKGTGNKNTTEIKTLAQTFGAMAVKRLKYLMMSGKSENVQAIAAQALLDRGYGKPVAQITHTGADDGPIQVQDMSNLEIARRMAFVFDLAQREKDKAPAGEQRTDH